MHTPIFAFVELFGNAGDSGDVMDLVDVHGSSRLSGDRGCRRRPVPWQRLIQPMGGMSCDAREDVNQPGLRVDSIHLGRLCCPPNYAEQVRYGASLSRWHRRSRARQPHSIRHSLVVQSVSRKASRRSFGWKRVRLPRSYGLSFARAASLRARWACRYPAGRRLWRL